MRPFFILVLTLLSVCLKTSHASVIRIVPSPISGVHGMFVRKDTSVLLADTFKNYNRFISKIYDQNGAFIIEFPSGTGLAGLTPHPTQDIFTFCDFLDSKVFWMDFSEGKTFTYHVEKPWNARWNPSGSKLFVVSDLGTVTVIDSSSSRIILQNLDHPFDVAPVSNESIWVSEQGSNPKNGRVCYYELDSSTQTYTRTVCNKNIDLLNPEGLWPLPNGSVVAVDTEAGHLVLITQDGTTQILETELGLPILVQVLANGNWVVFSNRTAVGPALIYGHSSQLEH